MTNTSHTTTAVEKLQARFASTYSSTRLQAALTAGTTPDPAYLRVLMDQIEVEPDFYVRDMLTWALTRHDHKKVIEYLLDELHSPVAQVRSQALHTLSKIGDPTTWTAVTPDRLLDTNDEVARTAWRTAAGLVPHEHKETLAEILATQFGRGDEELQRSLSAAFAVLGDTVSSVVQRAMHSDDAQIRIPATATDMVMADTDETFEAALAQAKRLEASRSGHYLEE